MSVSATVSYVTGKTLGLAVRQRTDLGIFGPWWNNITHTWTLAGVMTDRLIPLPEDGTTAVYSGGVAHAGLAGYTGRVTAFLYESIAGVPSATSLASQNGYMHPGGELVELELFASTSQTSWDSGGVNRIALDLAAAGGSQVAVSPDVIPSSLVWYLPSDSAICSKVITILHDSEVTVAVDLSSQLKGNVGIESGDEIIDSLGLLDIGDILPSQDRQQLRLKINGGVVAGNTHSLSCWVNLTNGNRLGATVRLRVV